MLANGTETKPFVVLVDDIPQNIQVLYQILSKLDYSFAIATNGEEVFSVVKRRKPDLILLDVMLPDIDGFSICRKLKEDDTFKDVPIIFLSAKTELEDKIEGFNAGGVDYITKPFEEYEVVVRVKTHLNLKHAKDELVRRQIELKDALDKLKKQQNDLVELEKRNSEMALAVTVNHELNQPLAVISGYMEMLNMYFKKKETSNYKNILNDMGEDFRNITDILKEIKKSETYKNNL